MIQDDAIRTIRERANIVEVVSDVVALKRRGRNHVGLCPFHSEKSGSFNVSEEKGFFHCFGCNEHGDVFTFVMKTQGLTFPDAVRVVAERFGLAVPESSGPAKPKGDGLYALTNTAQSFFRDQLRAPSGAKARAYLDARAIEPATIERFGIGWAPGGDHLARLLRNQGHRIDDAVIAGLLVRRDDGSTYDRFRARITFPITDTSSRVIAFGGRVLPGDVGTGGDPPPKYLNSPETPIFHKGHTLYGLALARDAIRRTGRVVVVEGYLDVIALAQAGIEEAVAPLGTALTADQLRVVRRFSETVIACFDGDSAGRRAAARSFAVFVEAGLWGRGVFLPAEDDPDTFVRAHGADAVRRLIEKAEPLVDAYLEGLMGPARDAVGRRADAAREVARVLRRLDQSHERDVLARLAAERLGVREDVLRAEGARAVSTDEPGPTQSQDRARSAEEQLVEWMATDPAAVERVVAGDIIAAFRDPTWRSVAEAIVAHPLTEDRSAILPLLPPDLRDRVVRRLLGEIEDEDIERALSDCIAHIRARRGRRLPAELVDALRAAEARGDTTTADTVRRELNQHLTEKGHK